MVDDFRIQTIPPLLKKPSLNPLVSEERLNPARWMYERLTKLIIGFEAKLSLDEEIGGRFITAPRDGTLHIWDISYWNPDMLIFHGTDPDGRPTELMQHYSQLSMQLCAVPKQNEKPVRIGFVLQDKLKEKGA
jgi:hypothetical protein